MTEKLLCGLAIVASLVIVLSVATRGASPEEVEPPPMPICAWPAELCCSTPPRLEVVKLAALRSERRWGGR